MISKKMADKIKAEAKIRAQALRNVEKVFGENATMLDLDREIRRIKGKR